jgi:hypothetical protein
MVTLGQEEKGPLGGLGIGFRGIPAKLVEGSPVAQLLGLVKRACQLLPALLMRRSSSASVARMSSKVAGSVRYMSRIAW